AIDVPGLAALLQAVGGVQVPGIDETITAENAARILLNDLYVRSPASSDQSLRREREADVVAATIAKLTTGSHDAIGLGRELGAAAAGGHLRLWSARQREEHVFESTGLGGGPATQQPDRTFHIAVQNVNATKLDYFVRPRVRIDISLTRLGTAVVRTSVVIRNTAPPGAPDSYQFGTHHGEYVTRTRLWGPRGATQLGSVPESGLVANQQTITVPAGGESTAVFETIIPNAVRNGRFELRLVPQARLFPMDMTVTLAAPAWHVEGSTTYSRVWDRTFTIGWPISH